MPEPTFELGKQGTIVRTQILAGHHDFHGAHRRRDPADRRGSSMDMGAVFIATRPASAFGSSLNAIFAKLSHRVCA